MVKVSSQQSLKENDSLSSEKPKSVLLDQPLTVPMDRVEFFNNCTLISDECLLLFTNRFRLITENKVLQLSLPFPRDINQIKTCTPIKQASGEVSFLVSCLMQSRRSKFISNFKKEHPDRVHAIRDKDRFNAWIGKWKVNEGSKAFEVDKGMRSSIFVRGDETESSQQVTD